MGGQAWEKIAVGRGAAVERDQHDPPPGLGGNIARFVGDFAFEDAGAAQTMVTERRDVGKVVLVP